MLQENSTENYIFLCHEGTVELQEALFGKLFENGVIVLIDADTIFCYGVIKPILVIYAQQAPILLLEKHKPIQV